MIIEALSADASAWDGAAVLLRSGYYAASLAAAGAALFHGGFAERLTAPDAGSLRRLAVGAALLAIILSLAALVVRAGVLSAGAIFSRRAPGRR